LRALEFPGFDLTFWKKICFGENRCFNVQTLFFCISRSIWIVCTYWIAYCVLVFLAKIFLGILISCHRSLTFKNDNILLLSSSSFRQRTHVDYKKHYFKLLVYLHIHLGRYNLFGYVLRLGMKLFCEAQYLAVVIYIEIV
jgi:hypothetical protein